MQDTRGGSAIALPVSDLAFVDKIDRFLKHLGSHLVRLAIQGTESSRVDVELAVKQGIESAIKDHMKAIDSLDGKKRESSWERVGEDIARTRFKIELYSQYLRDSSITLDATLKEAHEKFKAKLEARLEAIEPAFA